MTDYSPDSSTLDERLRGFTSYCGIVFDDLQSERCLISCPLRPELLNPFGVAHGGIIATILDVASGLMALQADEWSHHIVTQNCDIHYLRPASGERLWAEARLIRKGRRVCVVQADCYCSNDGRPSATSIYEIAYL
jgi:acyl-CoA thioesterase